MKCKHQCLAENRCGLAKPVRCAVLYGPGVVIDSDLRWARLGHDAMITCGVSE